LSFISFSYLSQLITDIKTNLKKSKYQKLKISMSSSKRNSSVLSTGSSSDNTYPNKSQNTNDDIIFKGGDTLAWLIALPEIESNLTSEGCLEYIEGNHPNTSDADVQRTCPNFISTSIEEWNKSIISQKEKTESALTTMISSFPWLPYFITEQQIPQIPINADPHAPNFIQVPTDDEIAKVKGYLQTHVDLVNPNYAYWETTTTMMTANNIPKLSEYEINYLIVQRLWTESKLNKSIIPNIDSLTIEYNNLRTMNPLFTKTIEQYIEEDKMPHLITEIKRKFDLAKANNYKIQDNIKRLKSSANKVLHKFISSAVLTIISSELRQENYIAAWQNLKDYYMKASSFSSTNVVKAAQDAKFEPNEHLEQWVDKMKKIFYNIALVNFLTNMQNAYPNDRTRWRPNHVEIENNSWDKTDDRILHLHHSLLLTHSNRLQYLINSLSLHPTNRYKTVLDNFRLKPNNELTVSNLYSNLLLWDNSETSTNMISNEIIVMNATSNEKCKTHPNSNHLQKDCRHPGGSTKKNQARKTKTKNVTRKLTVIKNLLIINPLLSIALTVQLSSQMLQILTILKLASKKAVHYITQIKNPQLTQTTKIHRNIQTI
jgi:hypothetical protein